MRASRLLSSFSTAAAVLALQAAAPAIAYAAGVDPSSATQAQKDDATAHFMKGRDLAAAGKPGEALVELNQSHDIVASPNTSLLIARCLRDIGKITQAYAALDRAAEEAQAAAAKDPAKYGRAVDAAKEEREEIGAKLGFLRVRVDHAEAETRLIVANEEVPKAKWAEAIPVAAGTTEILVETPGQSSARETVTLFAGERRSVAIDATGGPAQVSHDKADANAEAPPKDAAQGATAPKSGDDPAARERLRIYSYVAGGIGVAGIVTFAAAGLAAHASNQKLADECHGPCPANSGFDTSTAKTESAISNVGLVVGVVGLAAGVTMFVMSLPPTSNPDTKPAANVSVVAGPTWLGVRGAF